MEQPSGPPLFYVLWVDTIAIARSPPVSLGSSTAKLTASDLLRFRFCTAASL